MNVVLVLSEKCMGVSVDGGIGCDKIHAVCTAQLNSNNYYFIDSFQNKTVVDGCIDMSTKGLLYICCLSN